MKKYIFVFLGVLLTSGCSDEPNIKIYDAPVKQYSKEEMEAMQIINASGNQCTAITGVYTKSPGIITAKCASIEGNVSYLIEYGTVTK